MDIIEQPQNTSAIITDDEQHTSSCYNPSNPSYEI